MLNPEQGRIKGCWGALGKTAKPTIHPHPRKHMILNYLSAECVLLAGGLIRGVLTPVLIQAPVQS